MPEETSWHLLLGAQDQQLGMEQDQVCCGPTGISSGDCQDMITRMVLGGAMFNDSFFKAILHGTLKGRGDGVMPWLTEEMLDRQR